MAGLAGAAEGDFFYFGAAEGGLDGFEDIVAMEADNFLEPDGGIDGDEECAVSETDGAGMLCNMGVDDSGPDEEDLGVGSFFLQLEFVDDGFDEVIHGTDLSDCFLFPCLWLGMPPLGEDRILIGAAGTRYPQRGSIERSSWVPGKAHNQFLPSIGYADEQRIQKCIRPIGEQLD